MFATVVEIAQYYHIIHLLGFEDNRIISTVIGTEFDIKDILCYAVASVVLLFWEKMELRNNHLKDHAFTGMLFYGKICTESGIKGKNKRLLFYEKPV